LAYCTGIRRWDCSTKTTSGDDEEADEDDADEDVPAGALLDGPQRGREAGGDRGEDQQGHAVADALVGDQLAQPHDQAGAGGHGQHHDEDGHDRVVVEDESRARRVVEQRPGLLREGDERRGLQHGQADGQIARVLRHLRLARLALLLQGLEPRDHHREQLHDDAGRDVGHDPEREDRQLQQRAAAEEVDQAEQPVAVVRPADALLHERYS
jgi:hypothetical protein